jgi:hypothetical protein
MEVDDETGIFFSGVSVILDYLSVPTGFGAPARSFTDRGSAAGKL